MYADVLIAEIGSTTTLVSAFDGLACEPRFLGQGQAATTVLEGDVRIGLSSAINALKRSLNTDTLDYGRLLASSSAAGGLKMCVHGLVYDMTVSAAKAAALGAGAIVRQTTAGKLTERDLEEQRQIKPNLILLAGGTDYGERETALFNAELLAASGTGAPVLYAGNVQNQSAVKEIFESANIPVYLTENVYPRLDALNIEPVRKVIHAAFEQHIVSAP
ncbi:MAG: glutamate mutase L, partial [Clostridiaceae bacterium]